MDLYLLRHGDAAKGIFPAGTGDNSLTESAKKEIATVARSIKTLDPPIIVVLTKLSIKLLVYNLRPNRDGI